MSENNELFLGDEERGRKRKTDGVYASKYYDPDKAHAYYMAHRVLKGRTKKAKTTKKTSKNKYSDTEKAILQKAKDNTDENIQNLRDTVADWIDMQEEKIDAGVSKEEKAKIRKQIRAVRRAMNQQIRKARKIYRDFKAAYKAHKITTFSEDTKK